MCTEARQQVSIYVKKNETILFSYSVFCVPHEELRMFIRALLLILFIAIIACEKQKERSITGPSEVEVVPDSYLSYIQELDSLIYPLISVSPGWNCDDLQPLSFLGKAKIVGLGEATHGTYEFFRLKHRIFRFLVENYNLRIFGFEADMGESIFIDRYITTGEGDINEIMKNKMHFWTWKTLEVKELLEWMKTYNENKSEEQKIHYMGVDCQCFTYQPDLLLEYFKKVKPEFIAEINITLNMIKAMNNTPFLNIKEYYQNIDYKQKQELSDSLGYVLTKINDIESELISKSSHFEYQYMRQLIRNMQQVNDVIFAFAHNDKSINYRDKYMAENAIWLSTLFGENTKIAIWAHNGHVAFDPYYRFMGYHLKREIDYQYQVVGFSFSTGSFLAVNSRGGIGIQKINTSPPMGSLNYIFYKAKYENFILKISDIKTDTELWNWISLPRPLLSIGAVFWGDPDYYYYDIPLRKNYDVIIHYDRTTEAVRLAN